MKIVRCTENDVAELQSLSKRTFKAAFEAKSHPENFALYMAEAFDASVLLSEIKAEASVFYFFYTDDDTLLGYAKLRWDRSETYFPTEKALELQRIYIEEAFWGQGYGKQALDFCMNFAKENAFTWVFLVVWHENTGAIRFYEREGWEKFARKDFQFGQEIHHDHVMRKAVE